MELRKVNVSSGVEMLKGSWLKDGEFRLFMVNFANEFKKDDLRDFKYVLQKVIPAGTLENLQTPLEVFTELERRGIIGPGKLHDLRSVLEFLGKRHLCSMINEFDDSQSAYPLEAKPENFLELDGYRVAIKGGRHFETSEGEFVEVRSGANYGLTLTNLNCHRCYVQVKIDGYDMFPNGLLMYPKQVGTIERPFREAEMFKFYAVAEAPAGSGINKWRKDQNGLVEVVFTPERADMKIVCGAQGAYQVLTCSDETTDSEFYEMVLESFGATNATIMINSWKPLGKRDAKLSEYGIAKSSLVMVNFGGRGGVDFIDTPLSIRETTASKAVVKWRAGASTLNGESSQGFAEGGGFPVDPVLAVSLNLRLVARDDELIPLPSTGKCTPLARATFVPPPVPI